MKSTAHLHQDHQFILRALRILDEMACRVETGEKLRTPDAERLMVFLRGFADRFHQGKEEGVLFPALLQDRAQSHHPELYAAIFQHDRHRSLLDGLEEAIRTGNSREFIYFARRLRQILSEHVEDEEQNLFELANLMLSSSQDQTVNADMESYDLQWQNENLPAMIQTLVDLETYYIPRSAA